jgi:hypothetical protein
MNKKILILAILSMLCTVIFAQSIFSFHGPASISYKRDTFGEGMGGTGIGDLFRINASQLNPALATTVNSVHFATALSLGYIHYRDNHGNTFRDDQIYLPYLSIIVPFSSHRIGFNYYTINSSRLTRERFIHEYETDRLTYTDIERISTSLYRVGLFYANENRFLNFGIGLNYMFGHDIRFDSRRIHNDHFTAMFETENKFDNFNVNLGIARRHSVFSWGLAYRFPVNLTGETRFRTNVLDDFRGEFIYELPALLSLGITFEMTSRIFISFDMDEEYWSGTTNFENAVHASRRGVGLGWRADQQSERFFQRIPVRIGFSHRNLPFKVNDHYVYETTYHAGISIPLRNDNSFLDTAVRFFNRGNTSNHLVEDSGFLLTFGISGLDFIRRPPDRRAPRDIPVPSR